MTILSLYKSPFLIRYGNFIFRFRNKLFPAALIMLLVVFPPHVFADSQAGDFLLDVAALLVALTGGALRAATVGLEYIKRGGLNRRIHASQLVTHGMFAHCRNPLYLGNIMIALALLSLIDRLEPLLIGGVIIVLSYISVVAAEEAFLDSKFSGEYADYCRKAPRWLPKLRGLGATFKSMAFNWRLVFLKETTSFYGWVVIAMVIDGSQSWNNYISLQRPDFLLFLALFVVVSIVFVSVRILKHTYWLKE